MSKVFFFAGVLAFFAGANADCDNFKCVEGNENKVEMLGSLLDCPKGKVCNRLQTGSSCIPCVDQLCHGVYTCVSNMEVNINGYTVFCPEGLYCNREFNDPNCAPCRREVCPVDDRYFECTANKNEVIIKDAEQMKVLCSEGTVCNKDYLTPCIPCIADSAHPGETNLVEA